MKNRMVSTPTGERCVTSYAARTQYKPGEVHPPDIKVKDAIDIHCHAHAGQQNPFDLAKRASRAEMKGILFKSIVGDNPAKSVRDVQAETDRWADQEGIAPIKCWAGFICGWEMTPASPKIVPVSPKTVEAMIEAGVIAIWLPVFTHAITLNTVGTYRSFIEGNNKPGWTGPLPWEKALQLGHYNLDERGELKTEVREVIRICADRGAALFFGHSTPKEIYKLAEELDRVGHKRAVIDHPYSPFINLSVEQMKELSKHGILFNFTYDELSPLLGVDPQIMYNTIRAVGPEHFTLSSDAGEPLFPDSVESMRLIRAYMEAFGLTRDELYTVCTRNPARVVGMELN
jgi:hypothetical protein